MAARKKPPKKSKKPGSTKITPAQAALLQKAISLHQAGQCAAAQGHYETLGTALPKVAQIWHLRALCAKSQNQLPQALVAAQQAVELEPTEAPYRSALGSILRATGDLEEAGAQLRESISLDHNFAEAHVNLAHVLEDQKSIVAALTHARRATLLDPTMALAWRARGRLAQENDALAEAYDAYSKYIEYSPQDTEAKSVLARLMQQQNRFDEAEHLLTELITANPQSAALNSQLGQLLGAAGRVPEALEKSKRAHALEPNNSEWCAQYAELLHRNGDTPAAQEQLQAYADTEVVPAIIAQVLAQISRNADQRKRALHHLKPHLNDTTLERQRRRQLLFQAGHLLDKEGNHSAAFAAYHEANILAQARFDIEAHKRQSARTITAFSKEKLRQYPSSENTSELPVFVLGMPRSGTSLVERILASHPQVGGAGELYDIINARAALGDDYPIRLPPDMQFQHWLSQRAGAYVRARTEDFPNTLRVVDKMPGNFVHLGLIALLFPEARVIHVRRNPSDTCLSCFFQDFRVANTFSNSLVDLGAYYCQYKILMKHWQAVLPLRITEIVYEDLVNDVEAESKRLINFLGLDWDSSCLRFFESNTYVHTASFDQVRKPIYKGSVARHKKYAPFIGALTEALGVHGQGSFSVASALARS